MNISLLLLPNGLKAHLYYWNDLSDAQILNIIAPGMPNYPDKDFFASAPQSLHSHAFLVMYYYGYWFSAGDFNTDGASNSILDAIDAIQDDSCYDAFTKQRVHLGGLPIQLVGYSYGANPVLRAALAGAATNIDRLVLAAPLAHIHKTEVYSPNSDETSNFYRFNQQFAKFLANGYENIVRTKNPLSLGDYLQGIDDRSIVGDIASIAQKTLVAVGADDTTIREGLQTNLKNQLAKGQYIIYGGLGHDKEIIYKALLDIA